jgi:tRNA pseudouridine38-40 synthase
VRSNGATAPFFFLVQYRGMRIAIGISYDGAAFNGWQSQPSGNTIQDRLEHALGSIAGTSVRIAGAGRTDAGVHALAQVAHFDTEVIRPAQAWVRGANAFLPDAIAVQWSMAVPGEFNARYSAQSRRYTYVLYNHAVRPAVLAGKTGWFHAPLEVGSMREAARLIEGRHDFSAFRSSECQAKTPVRTLTSARVDAHGPYIVFEFTADAFLHHMVRNLVGSLVHVGSGRQPAAWLGAVLASRERSEAAAMFSAAGLYLSEIAYDSGWSLPSFPRIMPFPFPE